MNYKCILAYQGQSPIPRNSIGGKWEEEGGERGKEEEEEGGRGRSPFGAGAGSATVAYAAPLKYAFIYAICHTFCPP